MDAPLKISQRQFKHVDIAHGLINDLTPVITEGKFMCEKSELYLISVFGSSFRNSNGYLDVYIENNDTVITAFRFPQSSYVLTAIAIAIEQLICPNRGLYNCINYLFL